MQTIIYATDSGGVSVLTPVTARFTLVQIAEKDVPKRSDGSDRPWRIVDLVTLPLDQEFFDAWDWTDEGPVEVNSSKAQEIQRNRWRQARIPKLATLDVEYMRALESGDTAKQTNVAAQKQALRNVTLTPLPDDLEGIKGTWPEMLI